MASRMDSETARASTLGQDLGRKHPTINSVGAPG